jgi:hypothetical protein
MLRLHGFLTESENEKVRARIKKWMSGPERKGQKSRRKSNKFTLAGMRADASMGVGEDLCDRPRL